MSDPALQIFYDYLPLALQIAGGFAQRVPRCVDRDDLRAAARFGLWRAALKHAEGPEFSRGEFEAYVRVRIRGAILDELRSQDRVPRRMRRELKASGTQIDFASLSDTDEEELKAPLADIEGALDEHVQLLALRAAYSKLRPRLRLLLDAYLNGTPQQQIAHEMGISEPRVSQLLAKVTKKLRQLLNAGGLAP